MQTGHNVDLDLLFCSSEDIQPFIRQL